MFKLHKTLYIYKYDNVNNVYLDLLIPKITHILILLLYQL